MSILLTIDVEDYFQVENLRPFFPLPNWNSCDLRIEANTSRLLELFDYHNVKATFFVVGWIAERCSRLVREIRDRGHEVASHGYHHQVTSELSEAQLRDDLYRSKALLEDITGGPVIGYRAPNFSLSEEVWRLLSELGYRYDSSLNPFKGASNVNSQSSSVYEMPVSNLRIWAWWIPLGGGGYFRLWPRPWFEMGVARTLRSEGRYVFYIHPWEIDAEQPRTGKVRGFRQFKHYLNLDKTLDRLDHFLQRFKSYPFLSCKEYLQKTVGREA